MTTIKSASVNKDGLVTPVAVEVEITNGIGIHLVGLADAAVKESLLRTVTALQANGFHIPGKKIVINLAPADLCKNATCYDLPIALGILAESGQIWLSEPVLSCTFYGQLGLDGSINPAGGEDKIMDVIHGLRGEAFPEKECLVISSMVVGLRYSCCDVVAFPNLQWLIRFSRAWDF